MAGLPPRARGATADPGSPLHTAAQALLAAVAARRAEDAVVTGPARRRPDAFSYRVVIDGPDGPLLAATYRDPPPPELAALLAALDAAG